MTTEQRNAARHWLFAGSPAAASVVVMMVAQQYASVPQDISKMRVAQEATSFQVEIIAREIPALKTALEDTRRLLDDQKKTLEVQSREIAEHDQRLNFLERK